MRGEALGKAVFRDDLLLSAPPMAQVGQHDLDLATGQAPIGHPLRWYTEQNTATSPTPARGHRPVSPARLHFGLEDRAMRPPAVFPRDRFADGSTLRRADRRNWPRIHADRPFQQAVAGQASDDDEASCPRRETRPARTAGNAFFEGGRRGFGASDSLPRWAAPFAQRMRAGGRWTDDHQVPPMRRYVASAAAKADQQAEQRARTLLFSLISRSILLTKAARGWRRSRRAAWRSFSYRGCAGGTNGDPASAARPAAGHARVRRRLYGAKARRGHGRWARRRYCCRAATSSPRHTARRRAPASRRGCAGPAGGASPGGAGGELTARAAPA